MKRKHLFLIMLASLCTPTLVGCNSNPYGITFVEEETTKGPKFLEGSLHTIELTDTIVLDEYIDYSLSDDYKITISGPNNYSKDLTKKRIWSTENPGDYVITYTINSGKNKGTVTFDLKVKVPDLTWSYTLENKPYLVGEVLNFEDYFEGMNVSANSYYDWKMVMDSVEVGEQTIDLHNQTSYTFSSMDNHVFKFHIETEDGQRADARETISMKFINGTYQSELTSRNIETYGELYVDEGNLTLKKGQFFNGNNTFLSAAAMPHDLPYIAYKGNYGLNSFVKVDFTGNNMPLFSFFRNDDYSNTLFDETKGVLISGGFLDNNGNPCGDIMNSKISQYGPYLMYKYYDRDYFGDSSAGTVDSPYPGSTNYLANNDPNTQYRVLVGFTDYTYEQDVSLSENRKTTYEFIILDLTHKKTLGRFSAKSYNIYKIGSEVRKLDGAYDFSTDFFNGNIVLYGNYGKKLQLDNVYDIITGKTFDEALVEDCGYTSSAFKSTAPKSMLINKEYNRSDFGDFTNPDASLEFVSKDGVSTTIDTESFTITNPGDYTIYYKDGTNYAGSMLIHVASTSYVEKDNVTYYGVSEQDGKLLFDKSYISSGSDIGQPKEDMLINQSYLGLNGDYGINDFLKVDFTGNNMPLLSFFRDDDYGPTLFDESKGVLISGGFSNAKGEAESTQNTLDSRFTPYGPYLMYKKYYDRDYLGNSSVGSNDNPIPGSFNYLSSHNENAHYRMLCGFTKYSNYILTFEFILLDLDNHATLTHFTIDSYNIRSIGKDIRKLGEAYNFDQSFFNGNIVLYSNIGRTLTLDSMPEVITGKTFNEALEQNCGFMPSSFASGAPTFIASNTEYDCSIFGDLSNEKAYLKFEDANGNFIDCGKQTFSISQGGAYTVHYNDGQNYDGLMKISVGNMSLKETDNTKFYGVSKDGDKLTFESGIIRDGANYQGPNVNGYVDQAYAAFDGDYKLGDFIELDFTGKNFPEIAFFANNYDNSMYKSNGGKQGIVVTTGITDYLGNIAPVLNNGNRLNYDFPYMVGDTEANSFPSDNYTDSKLGRAKLVDGNPYKVIMGFVSNPNDNRSIQLEWKLIDMSTLNVIETGCKPTWNFFTGSNAQVNNMTASDLVGSIVLYGKFGTTLTVDKFSIHTNTTLLDLYASIFTE